MCLPDDEGSVLLALSLNFCIDLDIVIVKLTYTASLSSLLGSAFCFKCCTHIYYSSTGLFFIILYSFTFPTGVSSDCLRWFLFLSSNIACIFSSPSLIFY